MDENRQLMELIKEVYPEWCLTTGNTGAVKMGELENAVAMMDDLHKNGKLNLPREKAREMLWQILDELNEKSLYVQSRSFLPAMTKGLPTWAKLLVLVAGLVLLAGIGLFANEITAGMRAAQGITGAASYSIA